MRELVGADFSITPRAACSAPETPDHVAGLCVGSAPQFLDLGLEPGRFHGALRDQQQPVDLERLLDVVVGAAADRRDRRLDVAVARDHHHRHVRVLGLEHVEQLQPVEPRALHPDVEENQARPPPRDLVERGIGVMRLPRLVAFVLEDARDEVADVVLVVDDQNVTRHTTSARPPSTGGSSRLSAAGSDAASASALSLDGSAARRLGDLRAAG